MNGYSQTDVFIMALGLTEPWRVTNVEMVPSEKNPDKMEVHITVDCQEGSKFPCHECGESCRIYDSKQKVWRHLNFFQ
ncbi:MAG: ISL3 family transposase, partial [Sphaerochaetaceae bacterium]|nr:ISL3 family transposase [Sphaerochaetaceae bacterium]